MKNKKLAIIFILLFILLLGIINSNFTSALSGDNISNLTGKLLNISEENSLDEEYSEYFNLASGGNNINNNTIINLRGQAIQNFRDKKMDQINDLYKNTSYGDLIDINSAKQQLNQLNSEFSKLILDFNDVKDKKNKMDSKFDEIRKTIRLIIDDIIMTEQKVNNRIIKIKLYTDKLITLKKDMLTIDYDINNSKDNLITYINFLYKINNEYYDNNLQIDDIKLFAKSENIANTLSSEDISKILTLKLNELITVLNIKYSKYTRYSKVLAQLRTKYKFEVDEYKKELDNLREQRKYLVKLLDFLKEDKIKLDSDYSMLFENKNQLKEQILNIIELTKNQLDKVQEKGGFDFSPLLNSSDREDGDTFFSWPVSNIKRISAFFHDENYIREFGVDHESLDIATDQESNVYAPADGIVYKVTDQDSPGLNWMIMIHKHGYVTVYVHMYKVLVHEGDFIKRGKKIGLSGGQPGVRGSGLLTSGPHLHFEVIKNGVHVDPLEHMDLSIIPNEDMLQEKYRMKLMKDKMQLYSSVQKNNQLYETIYRNFYNQYGDRERIFYRINNYMNKVGFHKFLLINAIMRKESRFHLYKPLGVKYFYSCERVYSANQDPGVQKYINNHYIDYLSLNVSGDNILCGYMGEIGPIQIFPKYLTTFLQDRGYNMVNFNKDMKDILFWYNILGTKMKESGITNEDVHKLVSLLQSNISKSQDILENIPRDNKIINFIEGYNGGSIRSEKTYTYAKYVVQYLQDFEHGKVDLYK